MRNEWSDCGSSQWMTMATDRVRLHSIEFGCFVSPESFYGWKNFPYADVNNRLLNNSLAARPHSHTAPFAGKTIWSISDWPALGICVSDGTTEFAVHWAQIKCSLHLARAPGDIGPEVIESSRQQQTRARADEQQLRIERIQLYFISRMSPYIQLTNRDIHEYKCYKFCWMQLARRREREGEHWTFGHAIVDMRLCVRYIESTWSACSIGSEYGRWRYVDVRCILIFVLWLALVGFMEGSEPEPRRVWVANIDFLTAWPLHIVGQKYSEYDMNKKCPFSAILEAALPHRRAIVVHRVQEKSQRDTINTQGKAIEIRKR